MKDTRDLDTEALREEILDLSGRSYLNVDEVQRFYSLQEEHERRNRKGTLYSVPTYRATWQNDKGKEICTKCRFFTLVMRYRARGKRCKFGDPNIPKCIIRYPVSNIGCLPYII